MGGISSSTFGHYGGTEPVPRHWLAAVFASSVIYAGLVFVAAVLGFGTKQMVTEKPVDVKFVEKVVKEAPPPPPPPKPIEEAKPPPPAVPKDMKVRKVTKPPPQQLVAPKEMPQMAPAEADPSQDKGIEVWEPDAAELEGGYRGAAKEEITEQLAGVTKAKAAKSNEPPPYPKTARNAGKTGRVAIKYRITTNGRVEDIQVIEGDEPFLSAVVDTVKKWRYEPARYGGKPVSVYRIFKINFELTS